MWRRPAVQHLAVLLLFLGITLILFGPKVLGHLSTRVLARTEDDADFFLWVFRWWPHALGHGLNPVYSSVIYAPTGVNLLWTTAIPGPALLAGPVTLAAGPEPAFNLLALAAPALTGWAAYLLCRAATDAALPAVAGGVVFGFSSYEMIEVTGGHLNLTLALFVPLAAYLVVRHVKGSMSGATFVLLLTAVLVGQLTVSTEVFATMLLVGAVTGALGVAFVPAERRPHLLHTLRLAGLAYLLTLVVASPLLYAALAYPRPARAFGPGPSLARIARPWTLPLRVVVPGFLTAMGGRLGEGLVGKNGLYFGVPLLGVMGHVLWTGRRSPAVRTLGTAFPIVLVLAFGPALEAGGRVVPLPWALVRKLPLLGLATPGRLVMYGFLIASLAGAVWLAAAPRSWLRWTVVTMAVVALLPNVWKPMWTRDVSVPPFFSTEQHRRYLSPGEIVLVADPSRGHQMLWQATTDMYFRIAGGYVGVTPPEYARPSIRRVFRLPLGKQEARALATYVALHRVEAVVVPGTEPPELASRLAEVLGGKAVRAGGVVVISLARESAAGSDR